MPCPTMSGDTRKKLVVLITPLISRSPEHGQDGKH
jgi:hypothetical protein